MAQDDHARDLLHRGLGAVRSGNHDQARAILAALLAMDAPIDARIEAWRALAEIAADPAERRDYIGRILAFDPTDGLARRALAVMDGRLDPDEIIDPLRMTPASASRETADAPRGAAELRCPQCGSGRLVAGPTGRTVVCEHCRYEQEIPRVSAAAASGGGDFAAAIWTAKGHRVTAHTFAFVCAGCGASFLQPPGVQSLACAFCGSVHVAQEGSARDVLEPTAIVPFRATESDVLEALRADGIKAEIARPLAVFLPVWRLVFAGELRWKGFEYEREGFESRRRRVPVSGAHTVIEQMVLVRATGQLPDTLEPMLDRFDLAALVPFEPRHLAGHAAATSQVSLDEASVPARRRALEALREEIREEQPEVSGLEVSAGRFGIDAFTLLLLPFWTVSVGREAAASRLFVNGQTGEIGRPHTPGVLSWMADLLRRLTS